MVAVVLKTAAASALAMAALAVVAPSPLVRAASALAETAFASEGGSEAVNRLPKAVIDPQKAVDAALEAVR